MLYGSDGMKTMYKKKYICVQLTHNVIEFLYMFALRL